MTVDGCRNRTNGFARRLFAVHAHDRLPHDVRILIISRVVPVNSDPVHFAVSSDLFFADDRDVVFSLASGNAGVTSDADVHVDGHAPLRTVPFENLVRIKIVLLDLALRKAFTCLQRFHSLLNKACEGASSNNVAVIRHCVSTEWTVTLRAGDVVLSTNLRKSCSSGKTHVLRSS